MISGSDTNVGAKTDPFSHSYTVTDAQASSQTLTVVETLTNGSETITLRSYTATSGATNTVDLTDVWLKLIAGTHVLTITASDGAGGTATRKITFSRTVSRIAAARAFSTDALSRMSLFLFIRPKGRRIPPFTWKSRTNPVRRFPCMGGNHKQSEQPCSRFQQHDSRERLRPGLSLLYPEW